MDILDVMAEKENHQIRRKITKKKEYSLMTWLTSTFHYSLYLDAKTR